MERPRRQAAKDEGFGWSLNKAFVLALILDRIHRRGAFLFTLHDCFIFSLCIFITPAWFCRAYESRFQKIIEFQNEVITRSLTKIIMQMPPLWGLMPALALGCGQTSCAVALLSFIEFHFSRQRQNATSKLLHFLHSPSFFILCYCLYSKLFVLLVNVLCTFMQFLMPLQQKLIDCPFESQMASQNLTFRDS